MTEADRAVVVWLDCEVALGANTFNSKTVATDQLPGPRSHVNQRHLLGDISVISIMMLAPTREIIAS